jgi:hypothetical protein
MEYLLLHGETPVIEFDIDKDSRFVSRLNILNELFSPINQKGDEEVRNIMLNYWLGNRCIPNSREGIERIRKYYKMNEIKDIMLANNGLSLSDHYWIDKKPFINKWDKINLFENKYDERIGKVIFDKRLKIVESADKTEPSPEACTGGRIRKKWINENGNNYLIKSGSGIGKQEPFNEYFVTLLLSELNFKHVKYEIIKDDNEYASKCLCAADINKEMVSADDLKLKYGLNKSYESLKSLIEKKGNSDFIESLNKMIIIDFMIENTDRHWQNFGIIRDSKTGSWIESIPLFDNGYSFWNNDFIDINRISESQSFKEYNIDNMDYVNMENYVERIPKMEELFDIAFEYYQNKERKIDLRNGVKGKEEELINYLEKCEKRK